MQPHGPDSGRSGFCSGWLRDSRNRSGRDPRGLRAASCREPAGPGAGAGRTVATPGASARVNSAATSGTSARGEHGTAARHGAAGSSARVPRPHTAPCPGPAPAPTFLPRAQPRSLRFYRKGAVALLGRQMALRPQAWRFGSARAPRAAPQRRRGGAGADALVQVVLLEAPAPGLQRVVETRPGQGVLTFCFREVPRTRSLFEMLAIVVR